MEKLKNEKSEDGPSESLQQPNNLITVTRNSSVVSRSALQYFKSFLSQQGLISQLPDSKTYTKHVRWFITGLVASAVALDVMATNMFYPSLPDVPGALKTTPAIANLSVALPIVSTALCPIYWSYISERFGRRGIYLISLAFCVLFSILAAISSSIAMLIVMRILAAAGSAATVPTGAAVISDIWVVQEKGHGMSLFYVGIFSGPAIGPLIGGLVSQRWNWRAPLWFLAAYGVSIFVLILLFLPNTLHHSQSRHQLPTATASETDRPTRRRCASLTEAARVSVFQPLRLLFLLRYSAVWTTIYLASVAFFVIKSLQISIQDLFAASPYNFSARSIGFAFLPLAGGLVAGDLVGGRWSDYVMRRKAASKNQRDEEGVLSCAPEDRIQENAWAAMLVLPPALLWYGWSIDKGTHWAVPMVAEVFAGLGVGLILSLATTVLVELLPGRSGSLVALNSLGRNALGAIGSTIAQPLISAVDNGWYCTIIAILLLISCFMLAPMKKHGQRWREALVESESR